MAMRWYLSHMTKGRVEAFTDGVLAILITIMVLELKPPHTEANLQALKPIFPVFLSYILSFIYLGIYWSNHHHLYHAVQRISGMTLWANLHLLFWLSLIPFATAWMGENHFGTWPVVIYGVILLMSGVAWQIQEQVLLWHHDRDSALARAVGGKRGAKEWVSLLIYGVGIALAFVNLWIAP
jgi:uncharacterized membrane protein